MSTTTTTDPGIVEASVGTAGSFDARLAAKRDALLAVLRGYGRVAVAYSGGVDSAVVAKAAHEALGEGAVAVTAVSQSLASGELEQAAEMARRIGVRHRIVHTEEFADANYLSNTPERCYFCKSELYGRLLGMMDELGVDAVASGANLDDRGDHRPGMKAAGEKGVRHPLQEAGLNKEDVRALALAWGLPAWNKPAAPCLSSRIAYGENVTPERVAMIDRAEGWLHERGLPVLRVRYHKGDMARVEVPPEEFPRLLAEPFRSEMTAAFRGFGFKFVTMDLEGFRSGSLNQLVPADRLLGKKFAAKP